MLLEGDVDTTESPGPEVNVEVTVSARRMVADEVVELTLTSVDGPLPAWHPGAHIDISAAAGVVRQYSLCGTDCDDGTWRIAVLREKQSRGGSSAVHDALPVGAVIAARGPRNHFPLLDGPEYHFIAGGIGITPILAMIRRVQQRGIRWRLLYGGRTRTSMAYVDDLELLAASPDQLTVRPEDEFGRLDLEGFLASADRDSLVYCCGPEALISAVEERCREADLRPPRVERFAPRAEVRSEIDEAFEVELARSGRSLRIGPDESILDVLEESGVDVDSSCHEGVCGSCETTVLDGIVDHRDSLLTPAERAANDVMFICVSRCARGRLVLDL